MKAINICKIIVMTSILMTVQISAVHRACAQPELPARSVTVNASQPINFGTFCLTTLGGSGGTITVDWQGNRTSTGDIVLLSNAPVAQPAVFDIQLCQGRNVMITYSAIANLNGSNGGSLTLDIGPTEKGGNGSSFPVDNNCDFITQLRVGGTLTVSGYSANPGGNYSGNFSITFTQE